MAHPKSILLIYPGERVSKPRLPMSVLALATHLVSNNMNCSIVDERVTDLTDDEILSAEIIGISSMSGIQLKSAINTARRIKKINPKVPVIWGGAHATFFPVQTAESDLADIVVKGEGEEVFLELCCKILSNEDFSELQSITFTNNGLIQDNPYKNEFINIEELHFPMYSLFDLKKYADYTEGLSYESSRGCKNRCAFCYIDHFHKRKWRGKSVEKVISEFKKIIEDTGIKKLYLMDDNFFGDKNRTYNICLQMKESNLDMSWSATCRANILASASDEYMAVIRDSGCGIIGIGAESGSPDILKMIKKDITTEHIKAAVQKCVDNKIMPTVSFIIGFPYETNEDLEMTLKIYDELMSIDSSVEINGIFIFSPYPGTELFNIAVKEGYKPGTTLDEWANWKFSSLNNGPWVAPRNRSKMVAISTIARFKYLHHRFQYYSDEFRKEKLNSIFIRAGYYMFIRIFLFSANFRWKRRCFSFPVEWVVFRKILEVVFKTR